MIVAIIGGIVLGVLNILVLRIFAEQAVNKAVGGRVIREADEEGDK